MFLLIIVIIIIIITIDTLTQPGGRVVTSSSGETAGFQLPASPAEHHRPTTVGLGAARAPDHAARRVPTGPDAAAETHPAPTVGVAEATAGPDLTAGELVPGQQRQAAVAGELDGADDEVLVPVVGSGAGGAMKVRPLTHDAGILTPTLAEGVEVKRTRFFLEQFRQTPDVSVVGRGEREPLARDQAVGDGPFQRERRLQVTLSRRRQETR